MGIFDFFKDAGDDPAKDVAAAVDVSQERLNELRQQNIAKNLEKLDIEKEQVAVKVEGDKVVLTGTAPSQAAMEKMVLCAGNQHGISQVDCRIEVDAPGAPEKGTASSVEPKADLSSDFYTVKSGDTLSKIAAEHYGDGGKYRLIFEANQPMLTDPDKIYPGQSLRVPPL
jgi:nucleoid-associated protein YgaU